MSVTSQIILIADVLDAIANSIQGMAEQRPVDAEGILGEVDRIKAQSVELRGQPAE